MCGSISNTGTSTFVTVGVEVEGLAVGRSQLTPEQYNLYMDPDSQWADFMNKEILGIDVYKNSQEEVAMDQATEPDIEDLKDRILKTKQYIETAYGLQPEVYLTRFTWDISKSPKDWETQLTVLCCY